LFLYFCWVIVHSNSNYLEWCMAWFFVPIFLLNSCTFKFDLFIKCVSAVGKLSIERGGWGTCHDPSIEGEIRSRECARGFPGR
jgi:hypothetical protein